MTRKPSRPVWQLLTGIRDGRAYVFVDAETNMVRLPGCYDVRWADYIDWLWSHWDGEQGQ